ncbi:MAG: glycosyltransferase family 39 protein [Elusimicrobiota bacterium]
MTAILRDLRLEGAPRWLLLLLALVLTTPFWSLGHPLIEVDDARYAEIPREMTATRDWGTPHLNEMDYVEKPPLWYWLGAASYSLFGVSEAAARLPLALLALLGLLGTAWLGSWLYDPRTGWTAAMMTGTACLYFMLAHFITPDMGLAVWLLWCSAFLLRALLRPEDADWAAPAAWACAALAFLSKGLVALVFPGAWVVALWLLLPETRPRMQRLLRPRGPLLFLLITAPWFLLMEKRHPGFLRFFFYEHHIQRFATARFNRTNPWYFFLLFLPAGLLPWTPAVCSGLVQAWKDRTRGDARALALAAWALIITAFFSYSKSKLVTYILPVFPHLLILAARSLEKVPPPAVQRGARALGWLLLAAAAAAWPGSRLLPPGVIPAPICIPLGAAALAALGSALIAYGRPGQFLTGALAGTLAGALALGGMNAAAGELSCRTLSQAIVQRLQPGDLIYCYGTYLHGLPFYTRHRVDRLINWRGELDYAARDERVHLERFGGQDRIAALPLPGKRVFLICRKRDAAFVLSLTPADRVGSAQNFGPWVLIQY